MKAYVISGAAQGIGLDIAKTYLEQGARIAIIDVQEFPKELQTHKDRTIYVQGSSFDEEMVQSLVAQVLEKWGRIDGLINNAGIMLRKPLEELSLDDWNRVLHTNLTSAFLLVRECLPLLRKSSGGIVNISSTRAHQSEPNTESYAATKGGLLALTHSLAMSLGPEIRVNCISPGWIDSRAKGEQKKEPLSASDHLQHPVGRVGECTDVSEMVMWLLSEKSSFITGQEFVVDGGMTRKMIYVE